MSDSEQKRFETLVNSGLTLAKKNEAAKNILALLFPRIERVLNTYMPSDSDANQRKLKRRLSQKDFAESYFALTPQSNSWSKSEFEFAIEKTPQEAFDVLHRKLSLASPEDQSDLRRIFIELLDSEFSSRKILNHEWLHSIIEESPLFLVAKDEEAKFLFHVSNEDRLRWLIQNGLEKLPAGERAPLLESTIRSASDFSILSDIIRGITGDIQPEGAKPETRDRFSLHNATESIKALLLQKVRNLADANILWHQARPENLLWFWWGSNNEDEVKAFTQKAMNTPVGLLSLLKISVNLVRSTSGDYERVSPTWEKIVDLKALSERAHMLTKTGNEAEIQTANRFIDALARGRTDRF